MKDMKIVQEMYARGYDFLPLDLYQADARRFKIIDGKLMPALNTIEGLGENGCGCRYGCGKRRKIFYQKMISETGQKSARQSST